MLRVSWKYEEEQDICIASKYPFMNYVLIKQEKCLTLQEVEITGVTLNQMLKVNIIDKGTNRPHRQD